MILCRSKGMPSISVNFGPFRDVGMAASYAKDMRSVGLVPHEAKQAHCAFWKAGYAPQAVHARILTGHFTKINTIKGPWPFLESLLDIQARDSSEAEPDAITFTPDLENCQLAAIKHHTLESLVSLVMETVREVAGESVESHSHFADCHFDSLGAVELSASLGKSLGKDLPGTLIYDFPSVHSVATYLQSVLATGPSMNWKVGEEDNKLLSNGAQLGVTYLKGGPLNIKICTRLPGKSDAKAFVDDAVETVPYPR